MSQQHILYEHAKHNHIPVNTNDVHRKELESADWFDRFVDWIIDKTATKFGVITFLGIGTGSLIGYISGNILLGIACGALSSYILQLVYLAFLLINQKKSDRARQIQADEMFKMTLSLYHNDNEQTKHQHAQDKELIDQTHELLKQTELIQIILSRVNDVSSQVLELRQRSKWFWQK